MNKTKQDLIRLIEMQENLIRQQADVIMTLVNENVEQENMINVMMRERVD